MRLRPLIMLVVSMMLIGASVADSAPRRTIKWSDEFSGATSQLPDARRWSFETGGAGWGNNELECYTGVRGNASTDGKGNLAITAIKQPGHRCVDGRLNDFTSARITTRRSYSATYGTLAIRAKVPTGVGTWPAFWALGSNIASVGWPASGEIDIMEVLGREPSKLFGSVHGPNAAGERIYITREKNHFTALGDSFHVYAVEWTPTKMVYYFDGVAYATITRAEVEAQGRWVFDKPFYLLVNLAIGGDLGGPLDATSTWPQRYVIDYVRVYA